MALLPADLRAWTKVLVAQLNIRPGRRLGQHFLVDHKVLNDIIKAAEPAGRTVLEVGGGFGVLTLSLLEAGASVVVVEFDKILAQGLTKLALAGSNLTVIADDILQVQFEELKKALGSSTFIIVANLPYEISGAFLRRFLSGPLRPEIMVLLLQKEVAERLMSKPGKMSLISLLSAMATKKVEIVRAVKPQVFIPPPKVDSALVKLTLRNESERKNILQGVTEESLWQLARIGFAARRKMLMHNLLSALPFGKEQLAQVFSKTQLNVKARAQELSLEEWIRLRKAISDIS